MYTVYGLPFTRAMRVMWMLEELGQDYAVVPCAPQSDQIRAKNPLGKLPALEVDGEVLIDSVAICQFLADKHGALTHPAGTIARAKQDAMTQFAVDVIEGPLWMAAKHSFVLPEGKRVAEIKPYCKEAALEGFAQAASMLEGPYAAGETFTVPDLLLGHLANWAQNGSKYELPAEGPAAEYLARVRDRPALAAAIARGKVETPAAA